MIIDLVIGSVLNNEVRRELHGSSNLEALVIEKRGRSKTRNPQNSDKCEKSKVHSKSRKGIDCYHCGKSGCFQRNCWKLRMENDKEKEESKYEKKSASITLDSEVII